MAQMTDRRTRLKGSFLSKKSDMPYSTQSSFIGESSRSASFLSA
jgi:hypothetical protein